MVIYVQQKVPLPPENVMMNRTVVRGIRSRWALCNFLFARIKSNFSGSTPEVTVIVRMEAHGQASN